MDKLLKLWYEKLRPKFIYLIIILVLISILTDNKSYYINYIFLSACSLFLFLYAYSFRKNSNKLSRYNMYIMILSMIVCAVILSGIRNNLSAYIFYFIMVDDIFDNYKSNTKKRLTLLHFLLFMLPLIIRLSVFKGAPLKQTLETLMYADILYFLILFSFVSVHKNKEERDELRSLNCKLIEYSFNERDYLISKERSRISQELHDSLGHLLMALSMNVRYAKALDDKDKVKEELSEIESLVGESIKTLRGTVYSLKKLDEDFNLHEELKRLILKFNNLDIVKINLCYDDAAEQSSGIIKNILLSTVKEAITNSLKHGNASVINIDIKINDNGIMLNIHDNGIGCKAIEKSNGLSGICSRFEKVNGTACFKSKENGGFSIEASVPMTERSIVND